MGIPLGVSRECIVAFGLCGYEERQEDLICSGGWLQCLLLDEGSMRQAGHSGK